MKRMKNQGSSRGIQAEMNAVDKAINVDALRLRSGLFGDLPHPFSR
ncbi:hypothetical protein [Variovorax paradoxus]|nr:hypothetical protein INQ48_43210 [Variovorax paradoxus]